MVFGQRTQLCWDLPLADSFDLLKHIYHVPTARFAANLERCVELMEMGEFLRTPVRRNPPIYISSTPRPRFAEKSAVGTW